jgi:Zn-finger protein
MPGDYRMNIDAILDALDQPTKTCGVCFRDLPETEFRFTDKKRGKRHSRCKECFNEYQKERRKAIRRRIPHTYASEVNRARQRINKVIALTERMFEQLGGVNGAVAEWVASIEHAKAEGKWHLVLRSHKALFELVKVCDQVKPKVEDMGPEELAEALRADLIELIVKEPVLALLAAAKLEGWTVIPPPEFDSYWVDFVGEKADR